MNAGRYSIVRNFTPLQSINSIDFWVALKQDGGSTLIERQLKHFIAHTDFVLTVAINVLLTALT